MNTHRQGWPWAGAFTLIEMLVVIAIIGILAGILLPVIGMARAKARYAQARSDVAGLEQALTQYSMDFGSLPPDSNAGLSSATADFSAMDTPNECMVWYLTRTWSRAANAPGCPWGSWPAGPASCSTVHSRVAGGPYFSPKAKQTRDYDSDGFSEFVDPWGMPYFYRSRFNVTEDSTRPEYQPLHSSEGGDVYSIGVNEKTHGSWKVTGVSVSGGKYKISLAAGDAKPGWNSISVNCGGAELPITGRGDDYVEVDSDPGAASSALILYQFSKPYGANEVRGLWGSSGDGNDIEGASSNVVSDPKDRDDVCNWQ